MVAKQCVSVILQVGAGFQTSVAKKKESRQEMR